MLETNDELARRLADVERRLDELTAARAVTPDRGPRVQARFNQVYRADGFGLVTVWFASGRTGEVRILTGERPPPAEFAGEVSARSNGFGSAVVRPGEFWTLECDRADGGGFKALYTPLFHAAAVR